MSDEEREELREMLAREVAEELEQMLAEEREFYDRLAEGREPPTTGPYLPP